MIDAREKQEKMTHIVCPSHGSAPNSVKFYFKEGFFSVLRLEGKG